MQIFSLDPREVLYSGTVRSARLIRCNETIPQEQHRNHFHDFVSKAEGSLTISQSL
jgi:hypothetical protein